MFSGLKAAAATNAAPPDLRLNLHVSIYTFAPIPDAAHKKNDSPKTAVAVKRDLWLASRGPLALSARAVTLQLELLGSDGRGCRSLGGRGSERGLARKVDGADRGRAREGQGGAAREQSCAGRHQRGKKFECVVQQLKSVEEPIRRRHQLPRQSRKKFGAPIYDGCFPGKFLKISR